MAERDDHEPELVTLRRALPVGEEVVWIDRPSAASYAFRRPKQLLLGVLLSINFGFQLLYSLSGVMKGEGGGIYGMFMILSAPLFAAGLWMLFRSFLDYGDAQRMLYFVTNQRIGLLKYWRNEVLLISPASYREVRFRKHSDGTASIEMLASRLAGC